jgi:hypothetical protein
MAASSEVRIEGTPQVDAVPDIARFAERAIEQFRWLKENGGACFDEQLHLNEGSQERTYWHYGYMVALSDVLCFLTGERPTTKEPHILSRGTYGKFLPGEQGE